MTLMMWDEAGKNWTQIENNSSIVVDTAANIVSAQVNHFSIYGITEKVSVSVDENSGNIISDYKLEQNYPNPFNPETKISYQIPKTTKVTLIIYDLLGRKIKTLVNGMQTSGSYDVRWNGTNDSGIKVSSGIFFYQLKTDNFMLTKKMIITK